MNDILYLLLYLHKAHHTFDSTVCWAEAARITCIKITFIKVSLPVRAQSTLD